MIYKKLRIWQKIKIQKTLASWGVLSLNKTIQIYSCNLGGAQQVWFNYLGGAQQVWFNYLGGAQQVLLNYIPLKVIKCTPFNLRGARQADNNAK